MLKLKGYNSEPQIQILVLVHIPNIIQVSLMTKYNGRKDGGRKLI